MSAYSTAVLALTPSLYWTLDGTTGATDQSGNGRDGTGQGSISIGGYSGSPILGETTSTDFNDINDYVSSTYACFANSTTRTYLGWALRDTVTAYDSYFGGTNGSNPPILFHQGDLDGGPNTQITWRPAQGGASTNWTNPAAVTTWHMWALVFNETTNDASLYINGALISTQSNATAYNASAGNFLLGNSGLSATVWDGKMAHAAVFESALTAPQILNLYTVATTTPANNDPAARTFVHTAGRGQ